jgi:hypothetical protein
LAHTALGQNGWSVSRAELRKYDRYRLGAPVVFWWDEPEGTRKEASGVTRDISTIGIYVVSSACPPLGTLVQMHVSLPSLHGDLPGWRLEAQGHVVRVETSENEEVVRGFAVNNGELTAKLKTRNSL